MSTIAPGATRNRRRTLVQSELLAAEELVALPDSPPSGLSTQVQLAITFAGAFEFQVGRSVTWVDASRLLFAFPGEVFADRHVVPGAGHSSLILTPSDATLSELQKRASPDRVRACPLRVQMLGQLLRHTANPLAAEEIALEIMRSGFAGSDDPVGQVDRRCVRQAKVWLHDRPEGRFTLGEIASNIGVSPVYLTQAFKRSEGVPLYRYQTRLRIARALALLPERNDITDLALELGFSSHSHFAAAFRAALRTTPSQYRAKTSAGAQSSAVGAGR